jgi:predicted MFS family arabinose efflux permease
MRRTPAGPDARRIILAQALRALGYGFSSVVLGTSFQAVGWSSVQVGLLLAAILVGTAAASVLIGRFGDRIGRRRSYAILFVGLGVSGLVFGLADAFWVLALVALTGTLSTEVVESGPFTSIEQAMLPSTVPASRRPRAFAVYNAVATVAGSLGALAAGGPHLLREIWPGIPPDRRFLLVLVPIAVAGTMISRSLSDRVEPLPRNASVSGPPLQKSRGNVMRLAGLFAVDSFAGGFVVQAYIAYWFRLRFGVPVEVLGAVFFGVGLLQAGSFLAAARLADRVGLLNTMVFTHLPSNLLLAAIPLAPSLPVAAALLLGRSALSQMDVPTRQAYLATLVEPEELTAAAAYTNTARYVVRPVGAMMAGLAQQAATGLPFFLAGGIKALYDVALWARFRRIPLTKQETQGEEGSRCAG